MTVALTINDQFKLLSCQNDFGKLDAETRELDRLIELDKEERRLKG